MMKRIRQIGVWMLLGLLLHAPAWAADKGDFSTDPTKNGDAKWRIGYYEGGEYISYQNVLIATVQELMEMGWLEKVEIPPQHGEQTAELWQWLGDNVPSDYIEFVPDAHYSANWNNELGEQMTAEIIDRVNQVGDLDLLIAMGTRAGKALANDQHSTPTIVLSTSDPLSAGIIKSVEDSGYDHIHAKVDPYRYERQVRIFYDIIGFQRLGVAYEDSPTGRSTAAIDKVNLVAEENGFEVVSCYIQDNTPDKNVAEQTSKDCFRQLGEEGVDAIYVTVQNGVNPDSIPDVVNIFNSYSLPTFSQTGSQYVRYGLLMSISRANFRYVGRFHAETFAKVFNGAKPRDLDQIFESPPKIAINLKTAELINYDPPVDVLGVADEIYQEIEQPE